MTVHPYAKMGGCEDLLHGIAVNLAKAGISSVTFNTRGVGSSTGRATFTAKKEVEDVLAVVR